jgi:membrane peptidoglycan carboxypeptidase
MQLTRNLFLNKKKNLSRKLEELLLTWYLEKQLSKDEIIELYVNVVEFGPNLFGIREAAEHYFQKSPKELRPEEIVALTRLLPGPRLYAKFFERKRLSKAYTNRLNRLLALLVKRGHLEEGSFRKITPTNLWDPYEDEDSAAPEGSASPQQGAIEEPSHGTKPSVDPSALWGEPSYQAPPD